jgi:sugar lactone lactonase YvrE
VQKKVIAYLFQLRHKKRKKENIMSNDTKLHARLTTIAEFPAGCVLENFVVRSDNSMLVTVANRCELWFVPSLDTAIPIEPLKLFTFAAHPTGIVETEPDVFYISTGKFYNSDEAYLQRLDLRGWKPGAAVHPEQVLQFPRQVRGLNGSCLVAPGVMLLADSFAGLIWRVDLSTDVGTPRARVWLQHESMRYYPGQLQPEQPGINGIHYAAKWGYVYYTATAKKLFMRVQVHPETLEAMGEPEHVAVGRMADDFCIDEDAGVAYLTTHRENTIDVVSLEPARNSDRFIVAGDPFTEALIGPTSGAWSRHPGAYGKLAYFTADGGAVSPPPDGLRRPAKVLGVELPEVPEALRPQSQKEPSATDPTRSG